MIKVTMENSKVVIQANDVEECLAVIRELIKDKSPISEDNIYPSFKDSHITENTPVMGVRYIPTYRPTTREDRVQRPETQRKLVFFKCDDCGTIACSMLNGDETINYPKCNHCNKDLSIDMTSIQKASYKCECGFKGFFYKTEDVTTVKCKSCGRDHYLVLNEDTGNYHSIDDVVEEENLGA